MYCIYIIMFNCYSLLNVVKPYEYINTLNISIGTYFLSQTYDCLSRFKFEIITLSTILKLYVLCIGTKAL